MKTISVNENTDCTTIAYNFRDEENSYVSKAEYGNIIQTVKNDIYNARSHKFEISRIIHTDGYGKKVLGNNILV